MVQVFTYLKLIIKWYSLLLNKLFFFMHHLVSCSGVEHILLNFQYINGLGKVLVYDFKHDSYSSA